MVFNVNDNAIKPFLSNPKWDNVCEKLTNVGIFFFESECKECSSIKVKFGAHPHSSTICITSISLSLSLSYFILNPLTLLPSLHLSLFNSLTSLSLSSFLSIFLFLFLNLYLFCYLSLTLFLFYSKMQFLVSWLFLLQRMTYHQFIIKVSTIKKINICLTFVDNL